MSLVFCFFKQKTAYEMRISDWSSDVCSSDLRFLKESSSSALGIKIPDLPKISAYHLKQGQPTPCWPSLLRPPIAVTRSTGILTRFPSTTLFSLALGTDSPCVDYRCAGTLGLSACEFFTRIVVTHVSIRTSEPSRS